MRTKEPAVTLTDTSPAAASTVVSSAIVFKGSHFWRAENLVVDSILVGGNGGTLDVYLQRKTGTNSWTDWAHYPQISAGITKRYVFVVTGEGAVASNTPFDIGGGTDAAPGVALAVNVATNCLPTGDVRAVFVAGVGTSAGATQTITVTPFSSRK